VYSETLAGYVASVCTGVSRVFAVGLCFMFLACSCVTCFVNLV